MLDEIWMMIFRDHLDLLDVVRMRQVCKRFQCLVDQMSRTDLIVSCGSFPVCFETEKEPETIFVLDEHDQNGLKFLPNSPRFRAFQAFFANLKSLYLYIHPKEESKFNIETLNEFTKLERLRLYAIQISKDQTLNLSMLKTLTIGLSKKEKILSPHLIIDSKLRTLICGSLNLIKLNHPESIEFLKSNIAKEDNLLMFKNLRVLQTAISEPILNDFQNLSNLKEIRFYWNRFACRFYLVELNAGRITLHPSKMIDQLVLKSSELKKNVKIYLSDVLLTKPVNEIFPGLDDATFRDLEVFSNEQLAARIQHYHNLASPVICGSGHVDYIHLVRCLDDERGNLLRNQVTLNARQFPTDFFVKFEGIRRVNVNRALEDEERFVYFLSRCSRLIHLEFRRDSLVQTVLNQLPTACSRLKLLWVGAPVEDPNNVLDFSPVYKLKKLFQLWIRRDAGVEDTFELVNQPNVVRLLEECRYLNDIKLNTLRVSRFIGV